MSDAKQFIHSRQHGKVVLTFLDILLPRWCVSKHAWFDLNLAWRTGRAPDGSDNVDRILDTMGPYGAVMVTVVR